MVRPPLVRRAERLAQELGFERSCTPEVGRLLHALAAQRSRSRVGEIGTGAGVATAWLPAKSDPDTIRLLAPGGTAVLDDFTPGYADPDPVRELWLGHPDLVAVELAAAPEMAVILAVRVR